MTEAPAAGRDGARPRAMPESRNVLVIKLGAFGDVVLADGALRDVRAYHPGARITVLTAPAYAAIYARCPHVDVVEIDKRRPRWHLPYLIELRRRLRAGGYDAIYDLQNNRRTATYFRWMTRMKRPVAWSGTAPGCSHPHRVAQPKALPALERMASQLADAGLATPNTLHPDVSWMADDVSALMRDTGLASGFVLLIPGASARHPEKRWPHYARLAELLAGAGYEVATAPGPGEIDLCREIPAAVVMDAGRPVSFFQLAGLVQRAAYVVGNDTGPSHLAAHCGARGLALFGPHAPARRTGLDRRLEVIEVADLAALSPERVFEVAMRNVATQPEPA